MYLSCKNRVAGQALIEYLLIFGFIALVSINMAKGIGKSMGESMGNLAYVLTQQLSVGVCKNNCFYSGYKNGAQ